MKTQTSFRWALRLAVLIFAVGLFVPSRGLATTRIKEVDEEEARFRKMPPEEKKVWTKQVLEQVLRLEPFTKYDYDLFIHWAGQSGDREFVPTLKKVVTVCAGEKGWGSACFTALVSLQRLGEPKSYFVEQVKNYRANPKLASYVLELLARDPDRELSQLAKSIEKETENSIGPENEVYWSACRVADVVEDIEEFESLPDLDAKIVFLIGKAAPGTGKGDLGDQELFDSQISTAPCTVWAQKKLFAVSKEAPDPVARRIFATPSPTKQPLDARIYHDYVARFVSEDARAALAKLQAEKERSEVKKQGK